MGQTRVVTATIDHTKVINTDRANYTVVVVISGMADLKDIAHGGFAVTGNAGNDIRPYVSISSGVLGAAITKYQKRYYDPVAGNAIFYVQLANVTTAVDTTFVLAWGDATLNSDGSSNTAWDSHYKIVVDYGDGTSLSLLDLTSNANNLTNNAAVTAVAGPFGFGGGAAFASASSQYLSSATPPVTALPATIEMMMYETDFATNQNGVTMNPTSANVVGIQLDTRTTQNVRASQNAGQALTAGTFNVATWIYAAGRYVSTSDRTAYLNGVGTQDVTGTTLNVPNQLAIGAFKTNGAALGFWNGRQALLKISDIDRGDDYIKTTSNNMTSPLTFVTFNAPAPIGGVQVIVGTQPPSSVTSGVAVSPAVVFKATTDGVTVDTTFNGVATLTLASGAGTLTNASVTAVNGVATFTGLVVAGDGGGYTLSCAMSGYASVTSQAFVVIGTATAANQTLIAKAGGSASWPAVYDARLNVVAAAGKVATWDDAVGTLSGRTPGPQLLQGTAGKRPTLTGVQGSGTEVIDFVSASSTILAAAQDARFLLSGTGNQFCFVIAKVTVAGPLAGMASDPTSAAAYPFIAVNPSGANWKGRFGATGAGNETLPDSGLAFNDGVVRIVGQGKNANSGITGGDGNVTYTFLLSGRQAQLMRSVTGATVVAGGLKLMVGGLGASYVSATVSWVGYYTGSDVTAAMAAVRSIAATWNAVSDTSKTRTFVDIGDSLDAGTFSSDGTTGLAGSGTTTAVYAASRLNSGKGTFVAQGMDVADAHMFDYAVAGRRSQGLVDTLTVEVGQLFDGLRSGAKVVLVGIGTNDYAVLHNSSATTLAVMATLAANIRALGAKVVLRTIPDSTLWYTTGALNADGNNAVAHNAAIRATAAGGIYYDVLVDLALDTKWQINRAVSFAYTDATYYNGDGTHQTDAGYAAMGALVKAAMDANDAVLWPVGGAQSRLMIGVGVGL